MYLNDILKQYDLMESKGASNYGQQVARNYPKGGPNSTFYQAQQSLISGLGFVSKKTLYRTPKLGSKRLSAWPNKNPNQSGHKSPDVTHIGDLSSTQPPHSMAGSLEKQSNINRTFNHVQKHQKKSGIQRTLVLIMHN